MIPNTQSRVRELASLCQDLTQNVRQLAHSSESPDLIEERLRRAMVHVDLALEALESPTEPSAAPNPSKRFLQRFSSAVERMAGGIKSGRPADSRLKLAGSIACLRRAPLRPSAGSLNTSSATISIPDFLGFLQVQGKTGLLEVTLPREKISMHISQGALVEAFSDNSPPGSRLGEILVDQGAMDTKTLETFFVYHTRSQGRLGRALGLQELVSEEQLRAALAEQVVRMVRRMLETEDAPYVFHEGRIDASHSDFRLGVVELLLESMRQVDEARSAALAEPPAALPSRPGQAPASPDLSTDAPEVIQLDLPGGGDAQPA